MPTKQPLEFKVAPHIVEDLGLNLYTTLARVLVEFVANAYDADSKSVDIDLNHDQITKARGILKAEYNVEVEKAKSTPAFVAPLETRILPDDIAITIVDAGHGMSRDDLNDKFLLAGRRRRMEEPESKGRSPGGRPLMGRKGLGKLAGFGVARRVEVTTRKAGAMVCTKITLDYDELIKHRNVHQIPVGEEEIKDDKLLVPSGTQIRLSRLLYDPVKSKFATIQNEISRYFWLIDPHEFIIRISGAAVTSVQKSLDFAYPEPDTVPIDQFVEATLPREGGGSIKFAYRIRFTEKKQTLDASQRGVRVYAHKRLAAAPSLLGVDPNMHGNQMTNYMDGVVHADFIDEEAADYISTDRESLRWESPLLSGMHEFLKEELKKACNQAQKKRDENSPKIVLADVFTAAEVDKFDFSAKERKLAFKFAEVLEKACQKGVEDDTYRNTLPTLLQGIGHGNILTAISSLASEKHPDLTKVIHELVRLTQDELDQFMGSVKARMKGIEALKKNVEHPDFKANRNEKQIQKLFEECPWLVDPTYTQFLLSADVSLSTVFHRLAQELGIGQYAKDPATDKKEPDLVFLIGNVSLHRVVIVELKASNVELNDDNLSQLEFYMERAQEWLEQQTGIGGFRVQGHLIGTKAPPTARSQGAIVLRRRIREAGPDTAWRVRDFIDVLTDAEQAHEELLAIHRKPDPT